MEWTKETYPLREGHGWTARPGHLILALDRGAVVLEFPEGWFIEPSAGQVDIRDAATTADSTCVLAVSCLVLPPTELPLATLVNEAAEADDRDRIAIGPVHETARDGLTIGWTELRVVDPGDHRESRWRICLARRDRHQCLITLDYWPEDEARLSAIWDEVLESLKLGVRVDDPTEGPRID